MFSLKENINKEFVLTKLEHFIQKQTLKQSLIKAVDLVQEDKVEEAWALFGEAKRKKITTFEKGTTLQDYDKLLNHVEEETDLIFTGIHELDIRRICPARKELFLLLGRSGEGKTWFLINLAKRALLQKKRVLHLTLEMGEEKIGIRYLQSLFACTSKEATRKLPLLRKNPDGSLQSIDYDAFIKKSLKDNTTQKSIADKIRTMRFNDLIIKEYPEGYLTMQHLEAYLDNLESFYNFTPDLLLVDYPDLMNINPNNLRIETGIIYKQLRGLSKIKNMAVVAVTQPNKLAEDVKVITRKHVAEDKTKVDTADYFVTFNRTIYEEQKGLARLFVDKGRNTQGGQLILITQDYETGQFCLDSVLMKKEYTELTEEK